MSVADDVSDTAKGEWITVGFVGLKPKASCHEEEEFFINALLVGMPTKRGVKKRLFLRLGKFSSSISFGVLADVGCNALSNS